MKKYLILFLLLVMVAAGIGFYFFYKKPPDIRDLKENFSISSNELVNEFNTNETLATQKYSDKILLVTGEIAEIKIDTNPTIQLVGSDPLSGVTCSFYQDESPTLQSIKIGDTIVVKGKCTGKLMDVVLNNCRIQKR